MEPITSIVTVLGVVSNAVLGFLALWQRAKKRTVEQQLDTVEEGLKIVESAVESTKDVSGTNVVIDAIKSYGPTARHIVDKARRIMRKHKPI